MSKGRGLQASRLSACGRGPEACTCTVPTSGVPSERLLTVLTSGVLSEQLQMGTSGMHVQGGASHS